MCLLGFPPLSFAEQIVPAERAHEFIDQMITVEGRVAATRTDGRNTFLSLGSGEQPSLSVAITPPLLLSKFPLRPDQFYQGKTVRVSGKVYVIQGQPEMLINDADRIEVVGDTEAIGIREALRPTPSQSPASPAAPFDSPLPRDLVTGQKTRLLDLRPSPPQSATNHYAQTSDPCSEAHTLWQQVTQDLLPHLRAYTSCLEKASLGCDPEGEKVALGMLAVQQAQKQVRLRCK